MGKFTLLYVEDKADALQQPCKNGEVVGLLLYMGLNMVFYLPTPFHSMPNIA
jgi:hypothetical protein